jgi:hypothetical protein
MIRTVLTATFAAIPAALLVPVRDAIIVVRGGRLVMNRLPFRC